MRGNRDRPNTGRRMFLKGAGLTLTGVGLSSLFPTPFIHHAMAGPTSNKRLLYIFLRGGNDAVNTVIPHGDPDYNTTNRPTLYIAPEVAIDLNGFASLHPSLSDLMDVYNAGDLAVVHRVGYPEMTRSHFDGQVIWENGDPTNPLLFEGWLQRYIHEHLADGFGRFPAVGSPNSGVLVTGEQTYKIDVANPDNFDYGAYAGSPKRDKYRAGWRAQYEQLSLNGLYRSILSETEIKLQDAIDEYATWDQANWHPQDPVSADYLYPVDATTDPGGIWPDNSRAFFKNLKVCALSLLESDGLSPNGTRVAGAQFGGFDTHETQDESGFHGSLLAALGYGIRSLYLVLSGQANEPRGYPSIWDDTVIATMSEFGRTSIENGSKGTDHGNATVIFAAGGSINGGVYNADAGSWEPGALFGDEGRDLSEVTDYRAVFWEILRDHMGAEPLAADAIFPGYSLLGLTEPGIVGV
ncbi:MAG: DUF1501 domain-containing protein [Acidobacteriota bacterium]|nr:MAG: DUF1501 domain-containing protein [Acidobacteriota bacterium]